ncbi:TIGR00730 family Rossman fold protein [Patescibacteria group bacterium]
MKTITVYCSSREIDGKYMKAAEELSSLMVKNNYDLVWGGTDKGLMREVATNVQESGGKIIGISTKMFEENGKKNADEMVMTSSIEERKEQLLKRGDAIILLPGGLGSLDELFYTLELKKLRMHDKPVVVINIDKYYDGLKEQLFRTDKEGFIHRKLKELVYFTDNPKDAISYIIDKLDK